MRLRLFTLAILLSAIVVNAANGRISAHYNVAPNSYNFLLYLPPNYNETKEKTPVVINLHGVGLCGTDLNKTKRYGCINALEMGKTIDAIVVSPQCPRGSFWKPEKIHNSLEWIKKHYALDANRVYVIGMSLGGYGTMDYANAYPGEVAAAMPLCGGSTFKPERQKELSKVPLWIIHGTADRAIPVSASQKVVANIKSAPNGGELLRYDWLPGASHGALARCMYIKEAYDWLFSHSLADSPRKVNREISITNETLKNAYKTGYRGPRRRPTIDYVNEKPAPLGTIEGYAQEVEGEEVETEEEAEKFENSPSEVADQPATSTDEKQAKTDKKSEKKSEKKTEKKSDKSDKKSDKSDKNSDKKVDKKQEAPIKSVKRTKTSTVEVKKGDSFYKIAERNGMTVDELCRLNHCKPTDHLSVGSTIKVKTADKKDKKDKKSDKNDKKAAKKTEKKSDKFDKISDKSVKKSDKSEKKTDKKSDKKSSDKKATKSVKNNKKSK